ncbi:MAG: M48 family metalloprotease, partial [Kiritimatiellia bacterium]|nr:M48 family metalloprotease [Kiritimatiellia bacterium]
MNFFVEQQKARRNTAILVAFFVGCVVLTAGLFYGTMRLILALAIGWLGFSISARWEVAFFILFFGPALLALCAAALFKAHQLIGPGDRIALLLDAEYIPVTTSDPDERRLLNLVEEMSLASGMPPPPVYLMRRQRGINSFAAGQGPEDAILCVTQGCLIHLTRDEFQGILAHEFSHILNGDIRLHTHLSVALHGVQAIHLLGKSMLVPHEGFPIGQALPPAIAGLSLFICLLGSLGYALGRMLQSAISRQREVLADAAAIQFTRNPSGLAGALKKIGSLPALARIHHPSIDAFSHYFFAACTTPAYLDETAPPP